MSRNADGRHGLPRVPGDDPRVSPEDRQIGRTERMQGYPSPIPGGRPHITNAPTMRQNTPVADARPEYHDVLAHGVKPGSYTTTERAEAIRGPDSVHERQVKPARDLPAPRPEPVPVYLVEQDSPAEVTRKMGTRAITLNAKGGEAILLCGVDRTRVRVLLLNESSSSNIRFADSQAELAAGNGSLLPWPSNNYLPLNTQDEVWGISADTGTPKISIIQEFEQAW